jgi:molybdopterin converting factor small subunit
MNIAVNFFGIQRKILQQDKISITLEDEACVSDLLQNIRSAYPRLNLNEHSVMITINDRISDPDQKIDCNDRVAIIPHLGGG